MIIINVGNGEVDVQLTKEEGQAAVRFLKAHYPLTASRFLAKLKDEGDVTVPDAIGRVKRFIAARSA